jgi:hypothetical protein
MVGRTFSFSVQSIADRRLTFWPLCCMSFFDSRFGIISIKHRILATFNINKTNQFERLYAFNINQLAPELAISVFTQY